MPFYTGIQLAENLSGLVHHMASVEEYRETLQNLQGVWDNLMWLGQLSGTGTDMNGTRQAFSQLTGNLLNNLGSETLKKTVLEMKSKALVAVDIMIRNLFERTADIGFLATDDDLRDFLTRARRRSGGRRHRHRLRRPAAVRGHAQRRAVAQCRWPGAQRLFRRFRRS